MELTDHLFRQEAGRITAALVRIFGYHNMDLVEDVVQEAFCQALDTWTFRGTPENPSAWLMAAAKRKAIDALRRQRTARTFAPDLGRLLESEWTLAPVVAEVFEPDAIRDEQLRTMFSCCHPQLGEASQVALILNILCGFSVSEIAAAFVSGHAAIEKRIGRAKKVLADSGTLFEISSAAEISGRLPVVQRAIYLLFNEGYHGISEQTIREELCHEAIRLCDMLLQHSCGGIPSTYALAALMNLNLARLPSRMDDHGNLQPLLDQNRTMWDQGRIALGLQLLEASASGTIITAYHLEAGIAAVHGRAPRFEDIDWAEIIALYDALLALAPSAIVALSRAIAVGQQVGPKAGLEAINSIPDSGRLATYPFYFAAMGEFEFRQGDKGRARDHFRSALAVARTSAEQKYFTGRLQACSN